MLKKTQPDEIQSYLVDASNMRGGEAAEVVFAENTADVVSIISDATRQRIPVTVSGAGTGVVGGRVPQGGIVLATDRLNRIGEVSFESDSGSVTAEAGVMLSDLQKAVGARQLFYPPDPTESSCFVGGTVATNASGARSFKYGPTRNYVRRLKIVLPTGDVLDLRRGELRADSRGSIDVPLANGRSVRAQLPTYRMPQTSKHTSGYFIAPGMDLIDLFIGSEGTLGVVTEAELLLLPTPQNVLSGVVFFKAEDDLLGFVREARAMSLQTRKSGSGGSIDARALEYFDGESLKFLKPSYSLVPLDATGAVFFEQEVTEESEAKLLAAWQSLLERYYALVDDSWFASEEKDRRRILEFRHALPVLVNEWLSHHNQRKISTDMAVPDDEFASMLRFYNQTLEASRLKYVIFGHIGDNHVHVNILPRDDGEAASAREIYGRFIERAVAVGGTISAEHGIGKLKREYLRVLYGDDHLREMAALKLAFDPAGILGRGNIFAEALLDSERFL
jgi:D-lactate dehydrogenase (cytochrome)